MTQMAMQRLIQSLRVALANHSHGPAVFDVHRQSGHTAHQQLLELCSLQDGLRGHDAL